MTTQANTTALAPSAQPSTALTPMQVCEQFQRLEKIGEVFAKSGLFGSITASTGAAVAVTCAQEGFSPVQFKAKYHIFEDGSFGVKSRWLHAEFRRLGGKMHFNRVDDEVCDITFSYDGETLRSKVTLEQFKANGVATAKDGKLKKNWRTFPTDMLFARCCASAIRKLCPEADGGLYVPEEMDARGDEMPERAPVQLSPDEVQTRVSAMQGEAEAAREVAEPEVVAPSDPDVCPVAGKIFGKRWTELDGKALMQVLKAPAEKFPELTGAHRDAIVAVLAEREGAQS